MSEDESDNDACFYEMTDESPISPNANATNDKESMPSTLFEEFDENYYQIDEEVQQEKMQPYIDEPLTPSDEKQPNFHYSVLSQNEYTEIVMSYVDEVKDVLQLPSKVVKLLLHQFKWNKQRLLEEFCETDHDRFFQRARIINPFAKVTSNDEQSTQCLICCSDEPKQMYDLKCKHTFCSDCWESYLVRQITSEGLAQTISCPDTQCDILVDDEAINRFLNGNQFVKNLFAKIILNSYVDSNPRARWCPGKNCGYIINASSLTSAYGYAQLIICDRCQTSFCFQCAQPWHDPIKCVVLLEWNKKLYDDSQTVLWLKVNTKVCPKCKVNIEKNGGCNHMTCRNCHYEFCWLCFGKYKEYFCTVPYIRRC